MERARPAEELLALARVLATETCEWFEVSTREGSVSVGLAGAHAMPSPIVPRGRIPDGRVSAPKSMRVVASSAPGIFRRQSLQGAQCTPEEGGHVEVEDIIGFVQVVHTLRPIQAGSRGTLVDFALNDGDVVGYGTRIATIQKEYDAAAPGEDE